MIEIDGAAGEGGGQVLRTSLALAAITRQPFVIERIRARRKNPGLRQQHLTAVRAAAEVAGAKVDGAAIASPRLVFEPGAVRGGSYEFDVGTAGSATLVLQTVLPPLLVAREASRVVVRGGTYNPLAPPFDFLAKVFLPLVSRLGPRAEASLAMPGFYPRGGGEIEMHVEPAASFVPLELERRGAVLATRVRVLLAHLPRHIADRECATIAAETGWDDSAFEIVELDAARGPGNAVLIEIESAGAVELSSAIGERGVRAEQVARTAACEAQRYLAADVPVGEHLADQVLLPLAIGAYASGVTSTFRTLPLSLHSRTNIDVIGRFLDVKFEKTEEAGQTCRVVIGR